MDINTQTSQQKEGAHSLTEGKQTYSVPVQYGSEPTGAPMPVTEPIKGETFKIDAMSTSQQDRNEHDLPYQK